jgi:hypothetical protein
LSSAANPKQINLDRGPSSFDTRQRGVVVYNLDLPVGPNHRLLGWNNAINRQVLGGYRTRGHIGTESVLRPRPGELRFHRAEGVSDLG